jgi:hypothetical protein
MQAWLPLSADDPDRRKRRLPRLAPVGQEVADLRIQPPLGRLPGREQVVVDLPDRHRPHGGMGRTVIAPGDQQHPSGRPVHLMGGHQELHAAHLGHPLPGDQQRNRLRLRAQPPERGQRRDRRALGQDLVVSPEAAADITRQRLQRRGVVVHQQQHRRPQYPPPT